MIQKSAASSANSNKGIPIFPPKRTWYLVCNISDNNLQTVVSDKPMLMFFPGRYEVSATQGSSLVLFGQLKDDSFYRAKRILDQEA